MGWWEIELEGTKLVQGDDPYDTVMDAFDQISRQYQNDLGRRPSLLELAMTLERVLAVGLETYAEDGAGLELVRIRLQTRKRRKSQNYEVGDYFAIPIDAGKFGFGRILSDLRHPDLGMLIGIYDVIASRILSPAALKGRDFMFTPSYCNDAGWKSWRWKIIGHEPLEPGEFVYPRHKVRISGGKWAIQRGKEIIEASREDVEGLEYATMSSMSMVETRIRERLGGK